MVGANNASFSASRRSVFTRSPAFVGTRINLRIDSNRFGITPWARNLSATFGYSHCNRLSMDACYESVVGRSIMTKTAPNSSSPKSLAASISPASMPAPSPSPDRRGCPAVHSGRRGTPQHSRARRHIVRRVRRSQRGRATLHRLFSEAAKLRQFLKLGAAR
jgi:hypothetical protein